MHPFAWRGWFDYGCGAVGDMGCHTCDNVWWSMDQVAPLLAEPIKIVDKTKDTFPHQMIVKWEFAEAEDKQPALTAFWYEGDLKPAGARGNGGRCRRQTKDKEGKIFTGRGSGNLFIGTKGKMVRPGRLLRQPKLLRTAQDGTSSRATR